MFWQDFHVSGGSGCLEQASACLVPLCRFPRDMDLRSTLGSLLVCLVLCGICTGFALENCSKPKMNIKAFSVPGDAVMLTSTLLSSNVFDTTAVPHNITWYDSKTGQEMRNQAGRILVLRESLWFLNLMLEDSGEYVSIVRTPTRCYRQAARLLVEHPVAGECGKPRKVAHILAKGITDTLPCPLLHYIKKLHSYNVTASIRWYRGCDLIVDGTARYAYRDKAKLYITGVEMEDAGFYTCTLSFTLGGITGSVAETIDASVKEEYSLVPQVHQPAIEIIKAEMGSPFTKKCQVFVPCVGKPDVDFVWFAREKIVNRNPSDGIYMTDQRSWSQDAPIKGVWLERLLVFAKLREEDFNITYMCRAFSSRGSAEGYFTLLPAEPNIMLPVGLVLGGVKLLFIVSVIIYYIFKVDIVLWCRRTFPVLYANKDLDGKLYDAYVAYPPPCARGYSREVEAFAVHTLPQVLEKACGYKLFIAGRDCQPGQAMVDSVEENMQASRSLLLIYTASTFLSKRHTSSTSSNNNNVVTSKNKNGSGDPEGNVGDGGEQEYPDMRQQLECVTAMHRALLEGSLKVILVELEEITPAQLALFPESVRHLRKKQGAVCWWKNQRQRKRWRTRARRREDEEKGAGHAQLPPSLSPSLRFWKEVRYHMPVRGKRQAYPEKIALLNI